jgi:hypothetical protein
VPQVVAALLKYLLTSSFEMREELVRLAQTAMFVCFVC